MKVTQMTNKPPPTITTQRAKIAQALIDTAETMLREFTATTERERSLLELSHTLINLVRQLIGART